LKRDHRNLFCLDTLILVTPLVIGTTFYATLVAAEVGLKSLKTLIWGKK
jgi:hypothetical protein